MYVCMYEALHSHIISRTITNLWCTHMVIKGMGGGAVLHSI